MAPRNRGLVRPRLPAADRVAVRALALAMVDGATPAGTRAVALRDLAGARPDTLAAALGRLEAHAHLAAAPVVDDAAESLRLALAGWHAAPGGRSPARGTDQPAPSDAAWGPLTGPQRPDVGPPGATAVPA